MAHEQDLPADAMLLRYMSFAKLVAMLSAHTLHRCRLDELGDKDRFEGSLPRGQRERLVVEAQVRAYTLALRSSTYVGCWSQGPESEAMWRIYSDGDEGVAKLSPRLVLSELGADPVY